MAEDDHLVEPRSGGRLARSGGGPRYSARRRTWRGLDPDLPASLYSDDAHGRGARDRRNRRTDGRTACLGRLAAAVASVDSGDLGVLPAPHRIESPTSQGM